MTKQLFCILSLCLAMAAAAPNAARAQVSYELEALPAVPGAAPTGRYLPDPELTDPARRTTSNPVLWQQYQELGSGRMMSGCSSCGGSGPCNRCGCNPELFPWIDGPGRCDTWCVGPHWAVEANVLVLSRDDADWNSVIGDVGLAPTFVDQFENSPGARLFITGYNEHGFGIQVGYEGINEWNAATEFDVTGDTRTIDYTSRLHSVEINFLPHIPHVWKVFSGLRYVQMDEDFVDFTAVDPVIPVPADPPAAPAAFVETGESYLLENKLIGFQLGARRDGWQLGRWLSIESFANAGVYCNLFERVNVERTVTTTVTGDDLATPEDEFSLERDEVKFTTERNFSEIAFLGEVGVAATVKLNRCFALRSGYQAMVIDGVGEGLDAFFTEGFASRSVLYHGVHFGLEYRR